MPARVAASTAAPYMRAVTTSPDTRALVLFSGGQDSATCLAWALANYAHVETVGFTYGQRHAVEMECRIAVREGLSSIARIDVGRLGDDHILDIAALGDISDTALTSDVEIAMREDGLPNTFVPGRNLVFLTFAAALAYRRGISTLVGGMCQEDFSGYPDCRRPALDAQMDAINHGMATKMSLQTPLMHLTKAEAWSLAEDLGGQDLVELIVERSHTCYLGKRGERRPWGYGCGTCPACELRAEGYRDYRAA